MSLLFKKYYSYQSADSVNSRESSTDTSTDTSTTTTPSTTTSLSNASLAVKDKSGNVGIINGLTSSDISKLSSNIATTNSLVTSLNSEITARANADVSLGERVTSLESSTDSLSERASSLETTASDIKSNYVTTNTAQTISAEKIFSNKIQIFGVENLHWIEMSGATPYIDFYYGDSAKDFTSRIIADADNHLTITGDVTVTGSINSQTAVSSGTIIAFAGQNIPIGYLLCNGSQVSRTTYANLFSAIGTLYGSGDGSSTFTLPDLRDRFLEGANTYSVGTYISAGLPNILGKAQHIPVLNYAYTGAMFESDPKNADIQIQQCGTYKRVSLCFSANLSTSIYGKSSTVQPQALSIQYLIKY